MRNMRLFFFFFFITLALRDNYTILDTFIGFYGTPHQLQEICDPRDNPLVLAN
jgi:hypothetical protein